MPLYDFLCPACSSRREEFFVTWRDAPPSRPCPCGGEAVKLVGLPVVHESDPAKKPQLTAREMFRGTALEGTDGVNPYLPKGHVGHWEPTKATVDLGKSG